MRFSRPQPLLLASIASLALASAACGSDGVAGSGPGAGGGGGSGDGGASNGNGNGNGGSGGGLVTVGPGAGGGGGGLIGDPKTCEQAAEARTYLGCDFWPVVTANMVWSIFDFAVVVANAGDEAATVTVDRGGAQITSVTIAPNGLEKIYLPWVQELKGPDCECDGSVTSAATSSRVPNGAYHLVSSVPVTVYQFNALEYQPQGGPPGKDWSACPGNACGTPCFSYSNDASLLLPSTAYTNNYRVAGYPSWQAASLGSFVNIVAAEDATNVTVTLSPLGGAVGTTGVPGGGGGQQIQFPMARGESVQLFATVPGDLSGSLVQADRPIQVIHGIPCRYIPDGQQACDHVEESVLPAETLGERYFVTRPSGPRVSPVGHVVRFVGNVNGTTLTYPGGAPPGAPTTLNAGQLVDLGVVNQDFEVVGDHEFAVAVFQQGASVVDPGSPITQQMGDPAQSTFSAVEQYRTKYVFLAPNDYPANFVDIVMPMTAVVTLDGAAMSYQYPGGLNLDVIAPPPPPPPPPN
jgi:hypothetical protein